MFPKFKKLPMLQCIGETKINFVGMRFVFIAVSLVLIVGSIFVFATQGKDALGIDFAGGQLQEYTFEKPVALEAVRASMRGTGLGDVSIQRFQDQEHTIIIRSAEDTSEQVQQQLGKTFRDNSFEILRIENVGPVVGNMLKQKALWAILWSLLGILVYVTIRFHHFDFAFGGVVALIHDVVIAAGVLLLFGRQLDLLIVTALLTLAGYSINDTIVVYDRIRENMHRLHKAGLKEIINVALNQTLARSLLTSFTTLLVVLSLFMFGGEVLNSFALVLLAGFVVGTYSSIFIATPLVIAFHSAHRKRK